MPQPGSRTRLLPLLSLAAGLRIACILVSDRVVADVLRYRKLADHVLDVSWNPYLAPRLYPYPPLWVWVETACGWLARHADVSFAVLVKLPVLGADLGLVALLASWNGGGPQSRRAAWLYALHPVSLLVSGFHGQFDSAALVCVLLALGFERSRRPDRSALALSAGIALKSFPVLLLPLFLLRLPDWRARLRYTLLATLPVGVALLPFALHDPAALARELFGYGGVADFGWIGFWRGLRWLATGALTRAYPMYWGALFSASKLFFLAVYAGLLWALARGRLAWTRPEAALAVLLCFLACFGAISAQYLLWVVPLGLLGGGLLPFVHGAVSTLALVGFYLFLAPGVLLPAESVGRLARAQAGVLWVVGTGAVLGASLVWLAALVYQASPGEGRR